MKFNKKILLLPFMSVAFCFSLSGCANSQVKNEIINTEKFEEIKNNLGETIDQNMQKASVILNNFAFFGGNDVAYDSYNLYESDGYRNQIELFEDYVRYNGYGPYKVSSATYANYIYGKRLIFDFTNKDSTIEDVFKNFDALTKENKIQTVIYNIDTDDINKLSETTFKDSLKQLINKSLELLNNSGMFIIKTHYQTNDATLNQKINRNTESVKEVIGTNFGDDLEKIKRIGFVNHSELTKENTLSGSQNFIKTCLTNDNKLNVYGQLEMLYEFVSSIYKDESKLVSLKDTAQLSVANISDKKPNHTLTTNDDYVVISDEVNKFVSNNDSKETVDKIKNFQEYLSTLTAAKWQFFGDSLTYAGVQTWGYKGYVEYLRWILKNEFNRSNDIFLNEAVFGGRYTQNGNKYGEYSFPELTFKNYPTDILYVMMGSNDVYSNKDNVNGYFSENIQRVYKDFKETNKNGWMIVSSFPYFYTIDVSTMIQIVDEANEAIKNFAASKPDVIFIDNNSCLNNVVTNRLGLTKENAGNKENDDKFTQLYAKDKVHFNTNTYIIMTKNILSNLEFDYSKSQFIKF